MCMGAGGYQAVEPAHPSASHVHAASAAGAQATAVAAVPPQDCKDIPLGTDLTVSSSQDRTVAVALALLAKSAPVLPISLDLLPSDLPRLRRNDAPWVPASQQRALKTVVLLI